MNAGAQAVHNEQIGAVQHVDRAWLARDCAREAAPQGQPALTYHMSIHCWQKQQTSQPSGSQGVGVHMCGAKPVPEDTLPVSTPR